MPRRLVVRSAMVVVALAVAACGGSPGGPTPPVLEGPAVQSITPNTGPTSGGTDVTIRGLRFAAGATVTIGGLPATAVAVQSSETITATSPASAAGPADVVVTVSGRSGALPGGFTYQVPPNNNAPVISSITAQGSRPSQPQNFADLGETIAVSASVRDDETPVDQLEYQWSATAGTFTGTGSRVNWQAPAAESTPAVVTITLRVIERYGAGGVFQQQVTGTRTIALHDSAREVGDMARRFLTGFSEPQTNKDWRDIMRDFNASACPDPREVEDERDQVVNHYTNFTMLHYEIGPATVSFNFKGACAYLSKAGDACIAVPVAWDSTDNRQTPPARRITRGTDHLTGVYSTADSRWWLCSSYFQDSGTLGHAFYSLR